MEQTLATVITINQKQQETIKMVKRNVNDKLHVSNETSTVITHYLWPTDYAHIDCNAHNSSINGHKACRL